MWRAGALLKAGEETGGATVEEVTGVDTSGAVGSVAGTLGSIAGGDTTDVETIGGMVGLVVEGGTTIEVVETTGGIVGLMGGVVGWVQPSLQVETDVTVIVLVWVTGWVYVVVPLVTVLQVTSFISNCN